MSNPKYNDIEHFYSADIKDLLPDVQQSRPLYRFSNIDQPNRVDMNARIVDIRDVEEDLRMESLLLKQNNNLPLGRCSTPDPFYCYYCDPKHRNRCCLFVRDDDIHNYFSWTQEFEKTAVKPQNIKCIPEAVSYSSTPIWFPRYTPVKSNHTNVFGQNPTPRSFFQTFQSDTTWQELLDPTRPTTLTPYEQYIIQLRQLMQEIPAYQFDPNNPYSSQNDPWQNGINYPQQFNNQHIYNGPVFMQQNNYSPYYNPLSYSYSYDTYQSQQQQAAIPQTTPLTKPIGYHLERKPCALHPNCPMKTTRPHSNAYLPYSVPNTQPIPGYANPAAQVHSDGKSFPLWMLFSHNQSKSNGNSGSERKKCARQLIEVGHNCNIYCHLSSNGWEVPLQTNVDSSDKNTGDFPMQPTKDDPTVWNQPSSQW